MVRAGRAIRVAMLFSVFVNAGIGSCVMAGQPTNSTMATPSRADDAGSLLREIESVTDQLRQPRNTAVSYAALYETLVQTRARLIESSPQDDRLPTWLLDQAETMLDRLGLDGTDASVLVGVPTRSQVERTREQAAECQRLARRAAESIDPIVSRLEENVFAARAGGSNAVRAAAGDAERTIAWLVDHERSLRVPWLLGRAAGLQGLVGRDASRDKQLAEAIAQLSSCGVVTDGSGAGAAMSGELSRFEMPRRVVLGAARLAGASTEEEVAGALGEFQWVLERTVSTSAHHLVAACGVALGSAGSPRREEMRGRLVELIVAELAMAPKVSEGMGVERIGVESVSELYLSRALLLSECLARVSAPPVLSSAKPGVEDSMTARCGRANEGIRGFVLVLSAARDDGLRAVVYSKIAAGLDSMLPGENLLPCAAFAMGLELARSARDTSLSMSARTGFRRRGIEAVSKVIDRVDSQDIRAEALYEVTSLLLTPVGSTTESVCADDRDRAFSFVTRLASEFPNYAHTRSALHTATSLILADPAAPVARVSSMDQDPSPSDVERVTCRVQLLSTALNCDPPLSNHRGIALALGRTLASRWIEAARQAPSASNASMASHDFNDALAALARVGMPSRGVAASSSSETVKAPSVVDEAVIARDTARRLIASAAAPFALRRFTSEHIQAISRGVVDWSSHDVALSPIAELFQAEALIESNAASAADMLARLTLLANQSDHGTLDPEVIAILKRADARTRLNVGVSQRRANRTKEAFDMLRRLTEDLDRAPTPSEVAPWEAATPSRPYEFWCAWAELIDLIRTDGSNADRFRTVRLQLNTLKLIDPHFGGRDCGERLMTLDKETP